MRRVKESYKEEVAILANFQDCVTHITCTAAAAGVFANLDVPSCYEARSRPVTTVTAVTKPFCTLCGSFYYPFSFIAFCGRRRRAR